MALPTLRAEDTQAFILVDNRMYVVAVWEPGFRPLLEAYLSTMHLLPGGPAPAPTTPPSASSPAPS